MFSSQNSQVSSAANYIEDVFSTYLYTGDGNNSGTNRETGVPLTVGSTNQTAMLWIKNRSSATNYYIYSQPTGSSYYLSSNTTSAYTSSSTPPYNLPQVDASTVGFTTFGNDALTNQTGNNYVSWTFRKQPKFFDVVTYTGNGVDDRQIAHSLGSTPGCVMIKRTDTTGDWVVSHNYDFGNVLFLNTTAAAIANPSSNGYFGYPANPLQPTYFTLGTNAATNASGGTYVAYIFAHDAGGFGLTGTDNVISCGSFTTDSSGNATVNLGYEPQFLIQRMSDNVDDWYMLDIMRGSPQTFAIGVSNQKMLKPNLSNAEADTNGRFNPNATGFTVHGLAGNAVHIYIAIRRGPMKVPTSGTSVFSPVVASNPAGTKNTTNFPIDTQFALDRNGGVPTNYVNDRLRGISTTSTNSGQRLITSSTSAEQSSTSTLAWDNTGFQTAIAWEYEPMVYENFRRAPSFFDEVCYTGTGVANRNITHNLTVVPELVIVKNRTSAEYWYVRHANATGDLYLNSTSAQDADFYFLGTPTSTTFNVAYGNNSVNGSGQNYVAYLFSSCAGVSKVGGYTGTGTTQQINCGFTSGARFVLIKCASSSGDWYVWDSARGIVSGNDPYLLLNSTAAEVTNTDYIDTYSAGFEISSTAPAAINASGGTFIFLAIA